MMNKMIRRISFALIAVIVFMAIFSSQGVRANTTRTVKVAFFPMEGYNEVLPNQEKSGMDVDYLRHLCAYVDWNVEYVECDTWDDALRMLDNREIDLVGSAQYSQERAQKFDYAQLASGYTFGAVAVSDNADVAYEDFEQFKKLTFGMVGTYVRKTDFYDYFRINGIDQPEVIEFESSQELQDAMAEGQVDAMVHSFTEIKDDQRIVARFAPRSFYYITYKGNDQFLEELNQGICALNLSEPELSNQLMDKYYSGNRDANMAFSTQEKRFIASQNEIRVGYLDGYYPFSYEEDGEFKGLSRKVIENIAENSGLKFTFIKMGSVLSAKRAVKAGDIDILCYCSMTDEEINERKVVASTPYINIPVVLVSARGIGTTTEGRVGVIPELKNEAQQSVGQAVDEFVEYDNQEECLDAVASGKIDAAICDGFLAEYLLGRDVSYTNLRIERVLGFDHEIRMALSPNEPEALYSIIKKTLPNITDKQINEYIIGSNVFSLVSVEEFIRAHSVTIIIVLVILLFLGITLGIHQYRTYKKIQRLMYKDFNMDVWNLNYLTFQAKEILDSSIKAEYCIVSVNISQFRYYKTLFGWKGARKILETVIEVISDNVGSKEICARDQGDRFILFIKSDTPQRLDIRLTEIKTAVEEALYRQTDTRMTIFLGVYRMPSGSRNVEDAIANANFAMEAASEGNGAEIVYYDDNLARELKATHDREQLLKSVSIEDNFVTYYQAKVDIRTEEIVGAEALVRFKDPTADGMIRAPYYFVPYYEKTGRITEIDFYILQCVCKMLRKRLDNGEKVVPISCNFSRHHFMRPGFTDKFEAVLARYDIPKNLVEVEITETLIMEEVQRRLVKRNIDELTAEGIHLSIDDFGSGYSSLGVFEQIPASVIKLDRSFLLNQEDRNRQIAIMRGIVHMATDLDAQVVCEGVENDDDVALMREIDAYVAQGYKYSKPIPEDEFEDKFLSIV